MLKLAAQRLSTKIIGILILFFVGALCAIGLTLWLSWQLEGAAAAINDAGSLRMRSFKLLAISEQSNLDATRRADMMQREIGVFNHILDSLVTGDPARPLMVPKDRELPQRILQIEYQWRQVLAPALQTADVSAQMRRAMISSFVDQIDDAVHRMELSYAENTGLLRFSQFILITLAIIGTVFLIRFFFVHVIRPVEELRQSIARMEEEDFSTRVKVTTQDEFGELSRGFNSMAKHLQTLYGQLEQRVAEKTLSLKKKMRELEILYGMSAILRAPGNVEELSAAFSEHMREIFHADAAAVRLFHNTPHRLFITAQEGLSTKFVAAEQALSCKECLCGAAFDGNQSILTNEPWNNQTLTRQECLEAGFNSIVAVPIRYKQRVIGVFNLFFKALGQISDNDRDALESLGQQLGIAIENLRLQAREREMAVSEERTMMARELHDSIAQGLAYLNLQAQMLDSELEKKKLEDAKNTLASLRTGIQESYNDVRELLTHFRARVATADLDQALSDALRRTGESGLKTEFCVHGFGPPLGPEIENQVLYVIQEALSNVRKHSAATHVRVNLWRNADGGLRIAVTDDGCGFDPVERQTSDDGHIGLSIMQERLTRCGGRLAIQSAHGKGTTISVELNPGKLQPEGNKA